ncbi:ABC transporter ATP-binding protein [Thermosporothrix hazakensis]|uniref:ABC transporter ATP-binding protein n=1 Tax=Thermosporothrix hazakensis TaxID=644383 RepID=UPI001B860967|nr:ABC transporter ATP-binding protein [Thermosporothrix hazakensis]
MVFQDVHFEIQSGEFITIIGQSGSGKTTLLALLGALDTPTSGEIWVDGHAVHTLKGASAVRYRRHVVGFVFQLFYLLPNLTALENVMLPLLPYQRHANVNIRQRAKELLERVGLGGRLGHTPARLSGGEQQRVAIARALMHRPRLLLADEPTGNLDPRTGQEILTLLREIQREEQSTMILVTHDLNIAARADRCLSMEEMKNASSF